MQGVGLGVEGVGFEVWGLGFSVECLDFRGFRAKVVLNTWRFMGSFNYKWCDK